MVRVAGFEPARRFHQEGLNLLCLPISPHPHKNLRLWCAVTPKKYWSFMSSPAPATIPVPDSSLLRCTLFNWLIGTRFLTIRLKMRFFPTRLSLSVLAVSAHELAMVTCGISSLFKRWLLLSLRPIILNGVPRGTRTHTLLLRRQLHHPIMLLAQVCAIILAHFLILLRRFTK